MIETPDKIQSKLVKNKKTGKIHVPFPEIRSEYLFNDGDPVTIEHFSVGMRRIRDTGNVYIVTIGNHLDECIERSILPSNKIITEFSPFLRSPRAKTYSIALPGIVADNFTTRPSAEIIISKGGLEILKPGDFIITVKR